MMTNSGKPGPLGRSENDSAVVRAVAVDGSGPGAPPPLLALLGLSRSFGNVVAVDRVSLSVRAGQIHSVVGENGAGKTTLMNLVYGLLAPDEGSLEMKGAPVVVRNPRHAVELGMGMVHQHFKLVGDMTAAENVAVAAGHRLGARSHLNRVADEITALSDRYGLRVDPHARIEDSSVGVRQKVEILKLLYRGAEVLILDEPTATITGHEWEHLEEVLHTLAAAGKGIIFISHKLDEVLAVASEYTVLRDGRVVGSGACSDASKSALAELMVGREVALRIKNSRQQPGEVVLRASNLSAPGEFGRRDLSDIDLTVREREIVGIAGVDGNGQEELVDVLTGMRGFSAGELEISGERISANSPQAFRRAGGAVIPANRHESGIVAGMTVAENLALNDFTDLARHGVLRRQEIVSRGARLIREFGVRCAGPEALIEELSGGNQQKAVLARELSNEPPVLIAAQPTRGVDVGAIEAVYERLLDFRNRGGGILLVSTELDEILTMADRVAVMFEGRFMGVLEVEHADPQTLGLLMAGES